MFMSRPTIILLLAMFSSALVLGQELVDPHSRRSTRTGENGTQYGERYSQENAAQQSSQDVSYLRQVLYELLMRMEEATGREPDASQGVLQSSDQEIQELFGLMKDKQGFLAAARRVRDYLDSGRNSLTGPSFGPEELPMSPQVLGSGPFPPDYPPNSGLYYNKIVAELKLYGLISTAQDRCNSTAVSDYWSIWWELNSAATIGDFVCNVAGCDPSGIACAIICGISNTAMGAVFVAQRPIDLCGFHDANIDSAELQAGYENTVGIINNLNEHEMNMLDEFDSTQQQISAHDTDIKNEFAVINSKLDEQNGMLENVLANQREIIKLLNTPQGRRPDWNDDKKK